MSKGDQAGRRPAGKHGRKFHQQALALGFEVVRSKSHIIYRHSSGATVTSGSSPSEGEVANNLRRMRKVISDLAPGRKAA